MTKNELKKLRSKMPERYRSTLAKQFDCTEEYIDMILRGDRKRMDIIEGAIVLATDYQKKVNDNRKKIRSL